MVEQQNQTYTHGKREIAYTFSPAKVEGAPLVVILHGHTRNPMASKYRNPDWNVLCPIDNFGHDGCGSWFLGEAGDFFWLDAMPKLIQQVYAGDQYYFCGSSMGGYGSILHGSRMRARAVYANIPQTWLLGSHYSEMGMKRFFEPIFAGTENSIYNDLRNVLEKGSPTSFLLSGLRWDKPRYLEEQTLPFLSALCDNEVNFQSELRFGSGHALTYTTAQSIELFSQFREEIEQNFVKKRQLLRKAESSVKGST